MKKTLICTALLAACGSVAAQSNITLYGVVDGAIAVSKTQGESTRVSMDNGIWAGSRWGIKGSEDLGAGNSVKFVLESGFKLFNGQSTGENSTFSREATLGVAGHWGEVAFGRMGGLSSDCGTYTILHGSSLWTSYYNNGNLYGTFILSDRMNNTVVYRTPDLKGLKISAMYSNGLDKDEAKWKDNEHYYGLGADYNAGAIVFSGMVEMYDNRAKVAGTKDSYLFTFGGSYDLGVATLHGAYQYALHAQALSGGASTADVLGTKGANQHSISLSIGVPLAGGTAKLQGNFGTGKLENRTENNDYNLWSIATAYEYPLSKRTLVYSYAGYGDSGKALRNEKQWNSWTVSMGLSHSF